MPARLFILFLAFLLAGGAAAQAKKRIDKAADLPRFSYKLDGKIEDMVRDDAKFKTFAGELRRDLESVLAQYDIEDKATLAADPERARATRHARWELRRRAGARRASQGARGQACREAALRHHRAGDRRRRAGRVRTGLRPRTGAQSAQSIQGELTDMPYEVVANQVKEAKAGAELLGEGRLIGNVREVLQPAVDKNGSLSSDLAPALLRDQVHVQLHPAAEAGAGRCRDHIPRRAQGRQARHLGSARGDVARERRHYMPVKIAVWDSGVDTRLFPDKLATANGSVPVIAFDRFSEPAKGELQEIPDALKSKVPQLKSYLKGFSDLQSNIDSPEASAIKSYMSTLKPDQYKAFVEEISLAGELDARNARRRHSRRRQSVCAAGRRPHRVRLAPDPGSVPDAGARIARREELAVVCRLLQAPGRARGEHELGRQRERHRGASSSSAISARHPTSARRSLAITSISRRMR